VSVTALLQRLQVKNAEIERLLDDMGAIRSVQRFLGGDRVAESMDFDGAVEELNWQVERARDEAYAIAQELGLDGRAGRSGGCPVARRT
jgi:hypothetical protein